MSRGIHSRGYLPHWDFDKSHQAITFRLADSVPKSVVQKWRRELSSEVSRLKQKEELHRRISKYEDAGHGEAILSDTVCAEIVQDELISGHETAYELLEWCIMPNHVHVLCKLGQETLSDIVRGWKGRSSRLINQHLERAGTLWQREYHDRCIRDQDHLCDSIAYIRNNPVKAGLCQKPQEWPHCSVGYGWSMERRL